MHAFLLLIAFSVVVFFNLFMGVLVTVVWNALRPEHPIEFLVGFGLWFILATLVSIFRDKK